MSQTGSLAIVDCCMYELSFSYDIVYHYLCYAIPCQQMIVLLIRCVLVSVSRPLVMITPMIPCENVFRLLWKARSVTNAFSYIAFDWLHVSFPPSKIIVFFYDNNLFWKLIRLRLQLIFYACMLFLRKSQTCIFSANLKRAILK